MKSETPSSYDEAAELLRGAAADGRPVRFRGSGTKLGWGHPIPDPDLEICTEGLDRILEHNAGDFTAVLQAGVPLAVAEDAVAAAGQMLALDPPTSPWGGVLKARSSGGVRSKSCRESITRGGTAYSRID